MVGGTSEVSVRVGLRCGSHVPNKVKIPAPLIGGRVDDEPGFIATIRVAQIGPALSAIG